MMQPPTGCWIKSKALGLSPTVNSCYDKLFVKHLVMKKLLFLILITALLFSGCRSSKTVHTHFYLLELPETHMQELPVNITPMQGKCEIWPVHVTPAYASHQIALREASHKIRYFVFNEWAERPENRFTDILVTYLEKHDVFEKTGIGRLHKPANHVLETRVNRMLIDYQQELFIAEFDVEFMLWDASSNRQLFYHHARRTREFSEKNLNDFAAAISEIFAEELQAFVFLVLEL